DKDNENIEDKFIEDVYDARQILLKSMVIEKEKIDKLNIIFANMNAAQVQQSPITQVVPKPLIMPHSVSSTTLPSVESNDSKMKQWLKAFIDRKKSSTTNNVNENEDEMSVDSENNLEVANLPVTRHKGRRETKHYKSATEKTCRQPYACRTCGQVGHNSARCEKKSN
ncbi:1210_t:CDS:2, partial [Gigaspora margarita]